MSELEPGIFLKQFAALLPTRPPDMGCICICRYFCLMRLGRSDPCSEHVEDSCAVFLTELATTVPMSLLSQLRPGFVLRDLTIDFQDGEAERRELLDRVAHLQREAATMEGEMTHWKEAAQALEEQRDSLHVNQEVGWRRLLLLYWNHVEPNAKTKQWVMHATLPLDPQTPNNGYRQR